MRQAKEGSEALPNQPRPTTGPSRVSAAQSFAQAASNAFVDSAVPSFRPGSFPVLFNASAPEASKDIWFTPDVSVVGTHAEQAFEAVCSSDQFVHFTANAETASPEGEDVVKEVLASEFEASAVLCGAQSICASHSAAGMPVGDWSPVTQTDLVHLRSVRQIMAQYGDVRLDRVGHRYSVHHYDDTIRAFIRLAAAVQEARSRTARADARSAWWLPVRKGDGRTRFILACKLAALVKSRNVGFVPDVSWLESKILPSTSGVDAPPWLSCVFNDAERKSLEGLWSVYPPSESAFRSVVVQPSHELLGLPGSPQSVSMGWKENWKQVVSDLLAKWARRGPVLRRFFDVADKALVTGTSGSPAQVGSSTSVSGVFIASFAVDSGGPASSLSAAFPPVCVFDPGKEMDVKVTTTAPVRERAVGWIQKDFK